MRTTIALDDELLEQAQEYTGITEKAALIREALTRLVRSEAARRLAAMGGSDPNAEAAPRRRGTRGSR
jgi:Arc/MetJ family transcription regulator